MILQVSTQPEIARLMMQGVLFATPPLSLHTAGYVQHLEETVWIKSYKANGLIFISAHWYTPPEKLTAKDISKMKAWEDGISFPCEIVCFFERGRLLICRGRYMWHSSNPVWGKKNMFNEKYTPPWNEQRVLPVKHSFCPKRTSQLLTHLFSGVSW